MSASSDVEFSRRLRRALDGAAMGNAEDVMAYALLDSPSVHDSEEMFLVLAPIMTALVHVANRGAQILGMTRAEFLADVRDHWESGPHGSDI